MAPYMYIHCTVLLQAVLKNLHIGKISQKLCMYLHYINEVITYFGLEDEFEEVVEAVGDSTK